MHTASFRKVFWITLAWILVAVAEFGHTYNVMTVMDCPMTPRHARIMFIATVLSGGLAGLVGGAIIVYLFIRWLRRRPYGEALLRILGAFTAVFFGISVLAGFFIHSRELGQAVWRPVVVDEVFDYLLNVGTVRAYLFWLIVVLVTNITLLVNEKYGPGVFLDFLLGRYFRPRREVRIFMFLDLRSSTALAEQLGEESYFRLIQELFRDATPAILNHRGQIYQYVGDEIIVSWPLREGLAHGHCVKCFLSIRRKLHEQAGYYEKKYGLRPEFKAGLHYGYVMAGEVGVVKREIAYSGDVLNTTARIQSKCNELNVDVLLSETLVRALPPAIQTSTRALGAFLLRGKTDKMVVYTVGQ